MNKVELLFVPTPIMGHLVSTIEFGKRLIDRYDRILITILYMKWFSISIDAYIKSLVASHSDKIQIIDLPQVNPPSLDVSKSPEAYIYALVENYIPTVRNVARDIVSMKSGSDSIRIAGLVLDLFCSSMTDIATELDLPAYIYLTTNAAVLGLMWYLPTRHSQNSSEFDYWNPNFHLIPGFINPVPTRVLPSTVFNKDGGYVAFVKIAEKFKDAKGIMMNTFEELEHYALHCFSHGNNPPVYPVGPVISLNGPPHPNLDLAQRDKVMEWLDDQPESSVIFLCFGSMGSFEAPQVKEIALGLEQSGCRFLWSLRVPTPLSQNDESTRIVQLKYPEEMLPEGFLERIQSKGMICGWAPQLEVLAHKAIGGFVSHCGWNSFLESLWFGVPIVAWPLYAEQQLTAYMMKELGLAVEMRLDYKRSTSKVVLANEIEKAIRLVMDGENEVRKKVQEMSEKARKSVKVGESSFFIARLIEDIIGSS